MQKKLDVVFTIDENYIQHFCVACTSLLENNKNIGRIFLVQDIEENNKKLLKSINYLEQRYNVKIERLGLDSRKFENLKISHHISKVTYFRLLLSEILPQDVDNIMFLDSDIIVNGSLDGILELDFLREDNIYGSYQDGLDETTYSSSYEYYIFAVNHKYGESELLRLRKIGFVGSSYFNAGIMYINLKKWREDNISAVLIENAKKYNEHLVWWDQDVLNIIFDKEWGELDYTYNAFGFDKKDSTKSYKIIHYIGSSKPWHFRNNHPYKNLYWKYLKMTPFKRYFPEDLTVLNVIKWMIPQSVKEFIKRQNKMKIAIAGTGYAGLSNGILLAQHNEVAALDIVPEKVELLNKRISPIEDKEMSEYLKRDELNFRAIKEINKFKTISDVIVANRLEDTILDVKAKVYTRDVFRSDI